MQIGYKVIGKIKSDSETALVSMYKKYRKEFLSWIVNDFGYSIEEAKDFYQTTILVLFENIASGKLSNIKGSLKGQLFTIGKKMITEHQIKHNKLETTSRPIDEELSLIKNTYIKKSPEVLDLVERCLDRIGALEKSILISSYYNELTPIKIWKQLKIKNPDTLKATKYTHLQSLKAIFKEEYTKLIVER